MGAFDSLDIQAIGDKKATQEDFTVPVDYENGASLASIPAGTVFRSQADVDAALGGAPAFKHIMDVWDALPGVILHRVTLEMAEGVHRPRAAQTTNSAWEMSGKLVQGNVELVGPSPSTWPAFDSLENLEITSFDDGTSGNPSMTFAGTPFAGKWLKGLFVELDNGYVGIIHDHDDSTLYVMSNISPSPVLVGDPHPPPATQVKVARPSAIMRNAFTDGDADAAHFYGIWFENSITLYYPSPFVMQYITVDPWIDASIGIGLNGGASLQFEHSLIDWSFAHDLGGGMETPAWGIYLLSAGTTLLTSGGFSHRTVEDEANDGLAYSIWSYGILSIGDSFIHGGRRGIQNIDAGSFMYVRNVVFDRINKTNNYNSDFPQGVIVCTGLAKLLLSYYSFDKSKINEIRNIKPVAAAPDIACIGFNQGSMSNNNYRIILKDNAVNGVNLGKRTDIEQLASARFLDGGGNTGAYGVIVDGPLSTCFLSALTDISGTTEDMRVGGTDVAYADIEGLGQQEVAGINVISKEV